MERARNLVSKFRRRALTIRTFNESEHRATSGSELKKCLGAFDLTMLGIGGIIGSGVFVLTGVAANKYAGPGVMMSYGIAAIAALLAAICYTEYAVELPAAGGAFNYISMTYGEFFAWVVACDLILEYTLSAAAIAKGFTEYLAALFGASASSLRIVHSPFTFDLPALLAVLALSALLARGISESNTFNIIISSINLLLIVFVLCAGFPHAKTENYTPFLPFGLKGVFTGASVVFFSFIGFDTVATAAEEVRNPGRDLPIGIVGSLGVCAVLYMLMCLAITGMVPYQSIDLGAPFAKAFQQVGLGWATRIVAAGALTGIITSLLVSLLGQARIYVTLGRAHLLPPWMARIHPTRQTPLNATLVTACSAGVLALLLDIELLAELVSIGTLAVFFMVASGVLFRRYHLHKGAPALTGALEGAVFNAPGTSASSAAPVVTRIIVIGVTSIAFTVAYHEDAHPAVTSVALIAWFAATVSFHLLPVVYLPSGYKVPLVPYTPSLAMLATMFLIGSLGWPAYVRWVVWFILGSIVYFCYGLHKSEDAELRRMGSGGEAAKGEGNGQQRLLGGHAGTSSSADVELSDGGAAVRARSSPRKAPRKEEAKGDGVLMEDADRRTLV